ncbi:MAG: ATP-binding protein [Crenarchaeota archaeon]|nr:ATP-binding protein [Thermoproteota archaeon]
MQAILEISNFKTIEQAQLVLKPITVFIGPPDSGKSNTLEALALLSVLCYGGDFTYYFRTHSIEGLRRDYMNNIEILLKISHMLDRINENIEENFPVLNIRVRTCSRNVLSLEIFLTKTYDWNMRSGPHRRELLARCKFSINRKRSSEDRDRYIIKLVTEEDSFLGRLASKILHTLYSKTHIAEPFEPFQDFCSIALSHVRFYRFEDVGRNSKVLFKPLSKIVRNYLKKFILLPPRGDNINTMILEEPEIRSYLEPIVNRFGYRRLVYTVLDRSSRGYLMLERESDKGYMILYSLNSISHGLLKLILNYAALYSSISKVFPQIIPEIIVLEEPETHVFPYYTRELAETIIEESSKDKIIVLSTHNPYLLVTLLEKAPLDRVSVYWTYRGKRGYTEYYMLKKDDIEELLNYGTDALYVAESIVKERIGNSKKNE